MAEDITPLIVSLGETEPRQFDTWDALAAWHERESAQWEWLQPEGETNVSSVGEVVRSAHTEVKATIDRLRNEGAPIKEALPVLNNFYRPDRKSQLRLSTGRGRVILDVREIAGEAAAAFAYAYAMGRANLPDGTPEQVRGAILMMLPEFDKPAELADRLHKERNNNKQAQLSAIDRLNAAHEEQSRQARELIEKGEGLAGEALRRGIARWRSSQVEWERSGRAIADELNAVKSAFEEHMHLKAAADYWEKKRSEHANREKSARNGLRWFFILATLALGTAFFGALKYLDSKSSEAITAGQSLSTSHYLIVVGALVALSTLTFWIGRLLTRLYLSEHHLQNDAAERKVMTTTFLALTREGGTVTDKDRQIVLNAIFRATPDGIVKEEGLSDASLAAVISRLATR